MTEINDAVNHLNYLVLETDAPFVFRPFETGVKMFLSRDAGIVPMGTYWGRVEFPTPERDTFLAIPASKEDEPHTVQSYGHGVAQLVDLFTMVNSFFSSLL